MDLKEKTNCDRQRERERGIQKCNKKIIFGQNAAAKKKMA